MELFAKYLMEANPSKLQFMLMKYFTSTEVTPAYIETSTVQEVTAELNEILLNPAIRVKRKNGVKKMYKLKCYIINHVTRQNETSIP